MILNFSRLQVGDFGITPAKLCLPALIQSLIKEYDTVADRKSIKLSFENKCGEAVLEADEYCLAQAIGNLIDNAFKYTVKGNIKLVLYTDTEKNLKLDVSDTGIGISEGYIDHIFEPYSQEEVGYNRGYEGIGLGMSLTKKYLDLNGADISVVSKKDIGTTFTINFRNYSMEKSIEESENSEEISSQLKSKLYEKKPRILIVEDDTINQFYMNSVLKRDFETVAASSADSALEKIKLFSFDLILMDISLKGVMNGLELTILLRESAEYKDIPIIAVTGHTSEEDKKNCFSAGCNGFLSKPFTNAELIEKVNSLIAKT
jgi:CheY-like chemotaxis protein